MRINIQNTLKEAYEDMIMYTLRENGQSLSGVTIAIMQSPRCMITEAIRNGNIPPYDLTISIGPMNTSYSVTGDGVLVKATCEIVIIRRVDGEQDVLSEISDEAIKARPFEILEGTADAMYNVDHSEWYVSSNRIICFDFVAEKTYPLIS